MTDRPPPTPAHQKPLAGEGQTQPYASSRELREMLNDGWVDLLSLDPSRACARAQLVQAELAFRDAGLRPTDPYMLPGAAEIEREAYNRGFANAQAQYRDWDRLHKAEAEHDELLQRLTGVRDLVVRLRARKFPALVDVRTLLDELARIVGPKPPPNSDETNKVEAAFWSKVDEATPPDPDPEALELADRAPFGADAMNTGEPTIVRTEHSMQADLEQDEEVSPHEWRASESSASDLCGAMVMRDGGGDQCGLPLSHPVHAPQDSGPAESTGSAR